MLTLTLSFCVSEMTNSARPALEIGVDQGADVGVAGGHDAVERRSQALEIGKHFEPIDVGLGRLGKGLLDREVAGLFIDGLLGHRVGSTQRLPALCRHQSQRLARLGAGQRRLGLEELLVEVGRLDLGEQLTGLHWRADIDVPGLQEAAHPGIDRRAGIGFESTRQIERGFVVAGRRRDDAHDRNGLGVRPFLQLGLAGIAVHEAAGHHETHHQEGGDAGDGEAATPLARRRGGRLRRHGELQKGRRP